MRASREASKPLTVLAAATVAADWAARAAGAKARASRAEKRTGLLIWESSLAGHSKLHKAGILGVSRNRDCSTGTVQLGLFNWDCSTATKGARCEQERCAWW